MRKSPSQQMFPRVTTRAPRVRTFPRASEPAPKMKLLIPVTILLFAMSTTRAQQSTLTPDLLILNAAVRTMDEARPHAEAVAIAGNRIAAVGSTAALRPLA